MNTKRYTRAISALVLLVFATGCERLWQGAPKLTVPTAAVADSIFRAHGVQAAVAVDGTVIEVTAQQAGDQLRKGGALWARVGPYIYLLSPGTSDIFEHYPGVSAVRARTVVSGEEVARATLKRDTLRAGDWRHATNLLAQALREGTARPARLEELVRWGERYATYEYNPTFTAGSTGSGR